MGCEGKLDLLSRYMDNELSPEERAAFEEHLKGCEECRRALGEMRGTDSAIGRAVRAHRVGEGFVRGVMGRLSRPRGRWLLLGGGCVLAALAVALFVFLRGPAEVERAGVVVRAPEGSSVDDRAAVEGMGLNPGAVAGTTDGGLALKLGGSTVYLGGSTELRVDSASRAALLSGEVFVDARGPFRLKIRPALTARTEAARFGADTDDVEVFAGDVTVPFAGVDVRVPHGQSIHLGTGEFSMDDADLRALRPAYVPAELLSSPWPVEGGDARRSGFSPFAFPRAVEVRSHGEFALPQAVPGPPVVTRTNEPVVALAQFLFIYNRGRAELPGASLGSPCVFEGGLAVSIAGKGVGIVSDGVLERTFVCDAVAGCLVSWETVFVPIKGGLAAFGLDGNLLWAEPMAATDFPVSKWRGAVFAACRDGYLRALDAATGKVLASSIVRPAGFAGYPVVTPEGRAYAVSGSQLVWVEREGGTDVIELPEGEYPTPPTVDPSGTVYVCDGGGVLMRVSGRKALRVFAAGSGATAQPVCDPEGNVLIPAGSQLVCTSAGGTELWRVDLRPYLAGRVVGVAVFPNGSLFVTGGSGSALLAPTP